jgi:hypothetical protein
VWTLIGQLADACERDEPSDSINVGISQLAEELSASQERFCSMELVHWLVS